MERQGNGRERGHGRDRAQGSAGRGKSSRVCDYFASGHCRKGNDCNFLHEAASLTGRQQQQPAGNRQRTGRDESGGDRRVGGFSEARGQGRRGGEDTASDIFRGLSSYSSLSKSDEFRDFLGSALACLSDSTATPERVDNALQALCGVARSSGGPPSYAHTHLMTVLKDFRQRSSRGMVTAQVMTDRIVPLLRLLTHEALRETLRGHWVNPLYDTVLHELDFTALADVYTRIRSGDLPLAELIISPSRATDRSGAAATGSTSAGRAASSSSAASGSQCAGGASQQPAWRWSPSCMLDLIEPPVLLLSELLERFQRPEQRQVLLQGAAGVAGEGASGSGAQREGDGARSTSAGGSSGIVGACRASTDQRHRTAQLGGQQHQAQQQKKDCDGRMSGLVETLNALYERDLSESGRGSRADGCGGDGDRGGGAVRRNQAVRRRRFQEALRSVVAQLKLGESRRLILDEVEEAQRRQARAVAETAATGLTRGQRAMAARIRDPEYLPGALRRAGPRHDNDKADFRQIQLVPTSEELLCKEETYLPSNRAGSMPHLSHDPHRARLEVNFRLLRHDVVGPLVAALGCLAQSGGLARLGPLQPPLPQGAGQKQQKQLSRQQRQQQVLRMEGGSNLFVFRDVRFEGLALTRYDGTVVQVSFEQPASATTRCSSRHEYGQWWRRSKRLINGTLLGLWWEPQMARGAAAGGGGGGAGSASGATSRGAASSSSAVQQPPPQPRCVVGVVAQRDPEELAGKQERGGRPLIGIRLVNAADYEAMLGAWLDASAGAGGEVVMVQEHNSFFAYEPVLRALQGMSTIPLAQHLVPGCEGPSRNITGQNTQQGAAGTGASAPPLQALSSVFARILSLGHGRPDVSADAGPRPPPPDLPAYMADRPQYDLRHIVDKERIAALSPAARSRVLRTLSVVDLSRPPESFPMDALLAATTLDRAQAEALRAVLSQEVSVVQGPPGTGKTYLAVVLTRALLRNTCNQNTRKVAEGALPEWINEVPEAGAPQPAYEVRPHIGPLLVVCFTNHALDSFLEGLLEGGVTDSIVRVGGNSKSERLAAYNLTNVQEKVHGSKVWQLHKRADELTMRAERLSTCMQILLKGGLGRSMKWDELGPLLRQSHSHLYDSFTRGMRSWNRRSAADKQPSTKDEDPSIILTDENKDGFRLVGGGSKGRRDFWDLVSDDWLRGSPETDWRRHRLAGQQADGRSGRAAAMAGGLILSDDDDDDAGSQYELMAANTGPVPPAIAALCGRQRPVEELLQSNDVWSMSRWERQQLNAALVRLRYISLLDEVRIVQEEYDAVQQEMRTEYDGAALQALCGARVVGMTTSGVARMHRVVAAMKPRVLLVEEAAEVYEAHVLACLSRSVEQLVLIGDHEQLRPKPNVFELQAESGRGLDLDVSLFERLVRHSGFPVSTLEEQRRMRPEISRLIRETIYPQLRDHPRVTAYPHVRGLAQSLFFVDHDHPEGGAADEERSKTNSWEAAYMVALARHLLLQGYKPDDIVILVTYAGQLHKVREELGAVQLRVLLSDQDLAELERAGESEGEEDEDESGGTVTMLPNTAAAATTTTTTAAAASSRTDGQRRKGRAGKDKAVESTVSIGGLPLSRSQLPPGARVVGMKEGIRVATVDNYQGEEAAVILLSTVRNNPSGAIGFLRMRNRVNVMLSRARHGMVVLGHAPSLRAGAVRSREPMWSNVLDCFAAQGCIGPCLKTKCVKHGNETEIRDPGDFQRLVGDGGCQLPCGEALPCGHTCPRRCHVDDSAHLHVVCTRDCQRLLSPCGHPCNRRCGEPCGRCRRQVLEPYNLACGHPGPLGVECWRRHEKADAIPCTAMVEVTLPGCGHNLRVPCPKAEDARAGRLPCTQPVSVTMPVCGHVVEVGCGQRAAVQADPTRCPAVCGAVLQGCEHACGAGCGSCVRRALHGSYKRLLQDFVDIGLTTFERERWRRFQEAAPNAAAAGAAAPAGEAAPDVDRWLQFISAGAAGAGLTQDYMTFLKDNLPPGRHPSCRQPCTQELVCGHACGATCHPKAVPCRPCNQPCWLTCPHHTCKKPCGEPCVSCAEPCVWRCEHQVACGAPCGAPCDRLPCNVRCSRKLSCGHRCPGLCGESCPSTKYCVDPACMATAEERIKNQCVDMVMRVDFADLNSETLNKDPLLVLPCGHAFVTSTLDGLLDMKGFYACYARENWLHALPLGNQEPKRTCPTCRKPIHGVRRYGRALNKASLDLIERKYMFKCQGEQGRAAARLKSLQQQVRDGPEQQIAPAAEVAEGRAAAGPSARTASLQQQLQQLRERGTEAAASGLALVAKVQTEITAVSQILLGVCEAYQRPPKQRVYEAALATLQRAEEEEARADAAAAARTGDGLPAQRLRIARQDLAELRPNTRMLSQARIGVVECAGVFLAASAAGIKHVSKVLRAAEQLQLGRPAAGALPSLLPSREAAALRRKASSQLLEAAVATYTSMLADDAAPSWRLYAAATQAYNSAFELSAATMRLGFAQLQVLQAAGPLVREGHLPGGQQAAGIITGTELREMREAVCETIRGEGKAALDLYNGESGLATSGWDNPAISAIKQLLEVLEQQARQETDTKEMLLALSAVAPREYGSTDALSWLSSHLYRCPNGHLYVIGDCGGAMQRSRCAECGAVIGGANHRAEAGNERAVEEVRQLRAAAAGQANRR